jgi:hypothetical protein
VASIDSTIILYISGLSRTMMIDVSERKNVVVMYKCLLEIIEALYTENTQTHVPE